MQWTKELEALNLIFEYITKAISIEVKGLTIQSTSIKKKKKRLLNF